MLDDNGVIFGILPPGMQSHLSMLTKGIIISVSLARQLMIEPGKGDRLRQMIVGPKQDKLIKTRGESEDG